MASSTKVYFFFERKGFSLEDRSRLKEFIESMFIREKVNLQYLNFIFSTDKRLLEINKQYLQHNYYTDIITFELSLSGPLEAEIYISIDRVQDNARGLGVSFKSELHRVIFHGVLHLCGYGDKHKEQKKIMRKLEDLYVSQYFNIVPRDTVSG